MNYHFELIKVDSTPRSVQTLLVGSDDTPWEEETTHLSGFGRTRPEVLRVSEREILLEEP